MNTVTLMFKVRKWSDNPKERQPFDVVALDSSTNTQHYQPGVTFASPERAEIHIEVLERRIAESDHVVPFIKENWPVDGAIE